MAHKCNAPGCGFPLPDKYPLDKCPWHLAPGKGPVKIAAALTIAAAGFGGGFAYKKFKKYLDERKLRKHREESKKAPKKQKPKSPVRKRSTQKRPRKKAAIKSKQKPAASEIS